MTHIPKRLELPVTTYRALEQIARVQGSRLPMRLEIGFSGFIEPRA